MDVWNFRSLTLVLLAVGITGQEIGPTPYDYDCRRTNVGCSNGGLCDPATGVCDCGVDSVYGGYDCTLEKASVIDPCQSAGQCENNGECLSNGGCYCKDNTYGSRCENGRAEMWCTDTQMFINIRPHGDANFAGKLFVAKTDGNGRTDTNCLLQSVSAANLSLETEYPYVETVQGNVPSLEGFLIVLPHEPVQGSAFCQAATKQISENRTDYFQSVVVEYSTLIISSLDQVIEFNCSISKATNITTFSSSNAMSIEILNNDYQKVNVTDTIEPILFEIRDPVNNRVVTNNVNLGDPLDLVFTLQAAADTSDTGRPVDFKVTRCSATNMQPAGSGLPPSIDFLLNDCPAADSDLLYRDRIQQQTTPGGQLQTVIPLNAFRFVGSYDQVSFTCQITLCTAAQVAENPNVCNKETCPTDIVDAVTPDAGNSTTDSNSTNTGADTPPAQNPPPQNPPPSGRRKREANENQKEVSKVISVSSGVEQGRTDASNGADGDRKAAEEDCMQQMDIFIIVIIFVVVLVVMLCIVVVLVLKLLKSKKKVVESSDVSMADTQSRYSLPRLSLAPAI